MSKWQYIGSAVVTVWYVMPVLGTIFLRHAANRYTAARAAIEADQAAGKMAKRPLIQADFKQRRAMLLPPEAQFDALLRLPKDANLGAALVSAMHAIEAEFAPLVGQLPKDYESFDPGLLENLLRIFDSETLRAATGDVFGRIYEYFLMKFAMQGAQDSGEFFTPPALVQTVPCELWHLDRGKPEERRDQVLMIDARNVYRKVTRKIYDFSPEQLANLTAIVWLYRGQTLRFLDLVAGYFDRIRDEIALTEAAVLAFEDSLVELEDGVKTFADGVGAIAEIEKAQQQPLADALAELTETESAYETDRASLIDALATFAAMTVKTPPADNADQHAARYAFAPLTERIKGLVKQIDLLYKLTARAAQLAQDLARDESVGANSFARDVKALPRRLKQLDAERKTAVEQLKLAVYFHRQILWLQERFPEAEFIAVPGLCKTVTRAEIAAADWSLTPGRYVGVAPTEEDEDFDFERTLRDIHVELADLNREAAELTARIQENFKKIP